MAGGSSLFDQTEGERTLRLMRARVDEYTRECLALVVFRIITSSEATKVLDRLIAEHNEPSHVCPDSGPEFIAYDSSQTTDVASHTNPEPAPAPT